MEFTPKLTPVHFKQVKSGTLLIAPIDGVSYLGLAAMSHKSDPHIVAFKPQGEAPFWELTEYGEGQPVLCFSDYALRVPCRPTDWMFTPQRSGRWLVMCGDRLFILVRIPVGNQKTVDAHLDLSSGKVLTDAEGKFAVPDRTCVYTRTWSLWTTEEKPREILSFPVAA